jgi:hypothetical protein
MTKPKRKVLGYIDKSIEFERGSSTKARPGDSPAVSTGPRRIGLHVGAEDVGGGRDHAQTGVVPSGPGWREEAGRRVPQSRPRPDSAGHLTRRKLPISG